jgi:hypothetical protein
VSVVATKFVFDVVFLCFTVFFWSFPLVLHRKEWVDSSNFGFFLFAFCFSLCTDVFIRRVTLWTQVLIVEIGFRSISSTGVSNMNCLVCFSSVWWLYNSWTIGVEITKSSFCFVVDCGPVLGLASCFPYKVHLMPYCFDGECNPLEGLFSFWSHVMSPLLWESTLPYVVPSNFWLWFEELMKLRC